MPAPARRSLKFDVGERGKVSAILLRPASARTLYVIAHGAGAGMRHAFLESIAAALAHVDVATFRYQFPYMEKGKKGVDRPPVAVATVRAAVAAAAAAAPGLPIVAGGKSFGGRMTSTAAAESPLEGVVGLAFLGFPLHPPGRPGTERAAHLAEITVPMLFMQGTRDSFARKELLESVVKPLRKTATLHWIEDADHGFKVPKRTGRTQDDVIAELAQTVSGWTESLG